MHRLTNVPHHTSKCEMKVQIENGSVNIVLINPKIDPPYNSVRMCDLYIGDHMFQKPDELRKMVGDAMCFLIREARDHGYVQAQHDIRRSLGL